jgi:hypothetical protein
MGRNKRIILIAAVVVASALVTGARAPTTKPELYFVAIGDVPVDMIDGLVSHFRTKFDVPIRTLFPLGSTD